MLAAGGFHPRFLLPPPALASFLFLLPRAFWEPFSKDVFGGSGACLRTATMQPCRGSRLGGGRGAGWCERLQRTGLLQGWGRARPGLRSVRGPLVAALPAGKPRSHTRWQSVVACLPAARARALFTSEAWT